MKGLALACVAIAVACGLSVENARALPRTFVSGAGSGTACTRAAPCAAFQTAHDATDPNGEINCIDAGDFGGLSISKSITVDCTGAVGASGSGMQVMAGGLTVRLRGLTIRSSSIGVR